MTSEFMIAVHALVYLNHKQQSLSSEILAKNVCTNPVRIRKVMAKLKKSHLVGTKEGQHGGFYMTEDPKALTLSTIAAALNCSMVKTTWHSGDEDMDCQIASGMAGIMDDICLQLNESCLEKLNHITISDIDERIFG